MTREQAGVDPAELGRHPHAFVSDLDAPTLESYDHHHLARALRVRDGELVTLSDGRGRWRTARFGTTLEPVSPVHHRPPLEPALTVAFARTKGDRPEVAVQKLTELGIDRIVIFEAERSVARWDAERRPRQLARLERVVREAAMQSRRTTIPEIATADDLAAVLAIGRVAVAERGGVPATLAHPSIAIGPEGGWSDAERARISVSVGLGEHVLRAETASITAGVALATLRIASARERGVRPF